MFPQRINLADKLLTIRNKNSKVPDMLRQVYALMNADEQHRETIKAQLSEKEIAESNDLVFDLLETDKIFHLDHIKTVCVDYRLRFLDSHRFKAQIPEEAITKIKQLEILHNTQLKGFKIAAPSKLFKLDNYDDPLLFVPIGNDYYYLIHKWGHDMSAYRKWLVRPFRDFGSLLVLLTVVSLMLSLLVSKDAFGEARPGVVVVISFLFIFKALCGITLYYCFWKGKNFNTAIWNSDFYNH